MTNVLPQNEWLGFVDREYLQGFIADGGAAVKVAVCVDQSGDLSTAIRGVAADRGFVVAIVDSADIKVHMVDHLFFSIAAQIPWRIAAEHVVASIAHGQGYAIGDGPGSLADRIAAANGLEPAFVLLELRRRISGGIFRNRRLAKDFRVAMTHLSMAALSGGPEADTVSAVIEDWLTGRNKSISAVKPYQIFNRINRANARHLLESSLHWLVMSGWAGLTVVLDIRRVTVARNPRDEGLYYTKASVMDAYEVLRQFIDSTDRLVNCLIVVFADKEFLDEDSFGRGMGCYPALKFRVYDEVRDRVLANPMASLVRVSSEAQSA